MKITGPIPEHILKLMPQEDRPLGPAGFTRKEIMELTCKKREKSMHDVFSQWLDLNGIPYIHSRMDKRSTIQIGWPDFTIVFKGKALCIEFKMDGNNLSTEQEDTINNLIYTGTPVEVCWMAGDAIEKTRDFFKLNKKYNGNKNNDNRPSK
jgi:hypothetical protein